MCSSNIVNVLSEFRNDPELRSHLTATIALWRLGLETTPIVEELVNCAARVYSVGGEKWPIDLLGDIGPEAKTAVPLLTKVLDRPFLWDRRAAAIALRKIAPETWSDLELPGLLALP